MKQIKFLRVLIFLVKFYVVLTADKECDETSCKFRGYYSSDSLMSKITSGTYTTTYYDSYYGRQQQKSYRISDVEEIDLVDVSIEKFPNDFFAYLPKLKHLNASNVQLHVIDRSDFRKADELRYLDLSFNEIKNLGNMAFMHCTNLIDLDLSHNAIETIHIEAFDGISGNLMKINLSHNKITIFHEVSLIHLAKKSNSTTIDLSFNEISEIHQSNSSTGPSAQIASLNLQTNKIKKFVSSKLEIAEINMNDNQLEFFNVSSVVMFQANNNKLRELVISEPMRNVEAINNEIREIHCDKNATVEVLRLSGNKISNDSLDMLRFAENLRILDLSGSKLGFLKVETFAEMTLLEELHLSDIGMRKLGFGLFAHHENLKILNISFNHLGFIDYHMFTSLPNLTTWDISGNNLTKLKDYEKYYEIFPKLKKIGLAENSWNCGYLAKLFLSFEKQNISIIRPANLVKNDSSVKGVGCLEKNHEIQHLDIENISSGNLSQIVDAMNAMKFMMSEMKSNFSALWKNFEESQKITNATINEQKSAYDEVFNKTFEEMLENSKMKMKNDEQGKIEHAEPVFKTRPVVHEKESKISLFSAVIISCLIAIILVIVGVNYFKSYMKEKLQRMQRNSDRNSINTIGSINDSSV